LCGLSSDHVHLVPHVYTQCLRLALHRVDDHA
jgi:hypothetical protein